MRSIAAAVEPPVVTVSSTTRQREPGTTGPSTQRCSPCSLRAPRTKKATRSLPPGTAIAAQASGTAAVAGPPTATAPASTAAAATSSPTARKPAGRTDDGSVALALLEGRTPTTPPVAPKSSGNQGHFYLQVAAYSAEPDAQKRRDSLRQAGVTDAYVERGQSSGRTVYRLRVGPFGSHEAAQAAQARLRALGYQNSLIAGN